MGYEIPDDIQISEEGMPSLDPMTIMKWLQTDDINTITQNLTAEGLIAFLSAVAETNVKRIQEPMKPSELADLFYKFAFGVRERRSLPNTWQEHLVKMLKKCKYSPKKIRSAIRGRFGQSSLDVLQTFNLVARAEKLPDFFELK